MITLLAKFCKHTHTKATQRLAKNVGDGKRLYAKKNRTKSELLNVAIDW